MAFFTKKKPPKEVEKKEAPKEMKETVLAPISTYQRALTAEGLHRRAIALAKTKKPK